MNKIKVPFTAEGNGSNVVWNIMTVKSEYGTIMAQCVWPDHTAEDYGYKALQNAITKEWQKFGGDPEMLDFWWDSDEFLSEDAYVDAPVEVFAEPVETTVYEYAKSHDMLGDELEIMDKAYDSMWYAYPEDEEEDDKFEKAVQKLWRYLPIVPPPSYEDVDDETLFVDMSGLIKAKLPELKKANLFCIPKVYNIMEDLNAIFSGYVSGEWMEEFVDILCD